MVHICSLCKKAGKKEEDVCVWLLPQSEWRRNDLKIILCKDCGADVLQRGESDALIKRMVYAHAEYDKIKRRKQMEDK